MYYFVYIYGYASLIVIQHFATTVDFNWRLALEWEISLITISQSFYDNLIFFCFYFSYLLLQCYGWYSMIMSYFFFVLWMERHTKYIEKQQSERDSLLGWWFIAQLMDRNNKMLNSHQSIFSRFICCALFYFILCRINVIDLCTMPYTLYCLV